MFVSSSEREIKSQQNKKKTKTNETICGILFQQLINGCKSNFNSYSIFYYDFINVRVTNKNKVWLNFSGPSWILKTYVGCWMKSENWKICKKERKESAIKKQNEIK